MWLMEVSILEKRSVIETLSYLNYLTDTCRTNEYVWKRLVIEMLTYRNYLTDTCRTNEYVWEEIGYRDAYLLQLILSMYIHNKYFIQCRRTKEFVWVLKKVFFPLYTVYSHSPIDWPFFERAIALPSAALGKAGKILKVIKKKHIFPEHSSKIINIRRKLDK